MSAQPAIDGQFQEARVNLLGLPRAELEAFCGALGSKPFRARQLMNWLYKRGVGDFAAMTDLARDFRRQLGERTEVPELDGFVLSMIQADKFGVSIANVLRNQSKELRQKRRQRAEEQAQKVPVKLLFPMIFMVLPAMFIVILGPGALKVYDLFR